jgi:hypothetical protein
LHLITVGGQNFNIMWHAAASIKALCRTRHEGFGDETSL